MNRFLLMLVVLVTSLFASLAHAQQSPFNNPQWSSADRLRLVHEIADDFNTYTTAQTWTIATSVDGTVTLGDAANSRAAILTAAATPGDNEMTLLKSTNETYLFAANKPLYFEARVQYAEAATNAANVIVGLLDAAATTSLGDNGAGPPASYSGTVFYKVDGGTVWNCECSVGATQVTDATTTTAGGASYVRLGILWRPTSATAATVTYYINGTLVKTQAQTYTGATEMQVILGIKEGSTTAETLNVDYAYVAQTR